MQLLFSFLLIDLISLKNGFLGLLSSRFYPFSESFFLTCGKGVFNPVEKVLITLPKNRVFDSLIYSRPRLYLASLGIE